MKSVGAIRDKEARRKEKGRLLENLKSIKHYVRASLQVSAIGEVRAMVTRRVAELQSQRTLVAKGGGAAGEEAEYSL